MKIRTTDKRFDTTLKEQKEINDKLYLKKKNLENNFYYYAFSMNLISKYETDGKNLLDIGCGPGNLLKLATKKGLKTCGLDISAFAIKRAKKQAPNAEIVLGCAEYLPWDDNNFDYITCLCNIEHHIDPSKSISEITRVLSYKGRALILLPNSYFIYDILKAFFTGNGPDHGQNIERLSTVKEWQKLLEKNGLAIDKVFKYNQKNGFPFNLLRPLVPFNISKHFMFVCKKI